MSPSDRLQRVLLAFAPGASSTEAQISMLRIAAREFQCPEMVRAANAIALRAPIAAAALVEVETVPEKWAREREGLLAAYDAIGGDTRRGAAMAVARKLSTDPIERKSIERRVQRAAFARISDSVGIEG